MRQQIILSLGLIFQLSVEVTAFGISHHQHWRKTTRVGRKQPRQATSRDNNDDNGSSYESSASLTKGIVSSLTSLTNSIFQGPSSSASSPSSSSSSPTAGEEPTKSLLNAPTSSQELLSRIRDDYTQNNYLWTGKLDTSAFVSNCTFTDPTLSFVGVDKFVENVGNLVPVVNFLLGEEQLSRSELLNITLNDEEKYIETRWNMVGELNQLIWKPKIDVIGRTKFWYKEVEEGKGDPAFQVYFYDEMWEIPAGLALLQLVTKAGTIANTGDRKD